MPDKVIVWDNAGVRSVHEGTAKGGAVALAKMFRTLSNRTVKVADAFGSTYHWSRSVHLPPNQWSTRAVASEAFD
jgi:hypothetical protein